MKKFLEYYLLAGATWAGYKFFIGKVPAPQAAQLVVTWPLDLTGLATPYPLTTGLFAGLGAVHPAVAAHPHTAVSVPPPPRRRFPPQRHQNPLHPYVSPYRPY